MHPMMLSSLRLTMPLFNLYVSLLFSVLCLTKAFLYFYLLGLPMVTELWWLNNNLLLVFLRFYFPIVIGLWWQKIGLILFACFNHVYKCVLRSYSFCCVLSFSSSFIYNLNDRVVRSRFAFKWWLRLLSHLQEGKSYLRKYNDWELFERACLYLERIGSLVYIKKKLKKKIDVFRSIQENLM